MHDDNMPASWLFDDDEPIDETGGAALAALGFLLILISGLAGVAATIYFWLVR